MQEWILVTPEDLQKKEMEWFEGLKAEFEKDYGWLEINGLFIKNKFRLYHWGHSRLMELLLRHDHVGRQYYPELFPKGGGQLKLAKVTVDRNLCAWGWYDDTPDFFIQENISQDDKQRTSDLIFDFHFKNSSDQIHLLNKIDIIIEDAWTQLSGIPKDMFLRSVGVLEFDIDFSKKVNTLTFNDPMIFEPQKATRFHLQLTRFVEKCRDNRAQIKFWFHFDELQIITNSIVLAM